MIIVDARTDREKLVELRQLPEQPHLEFKAELDSTAKSDEVNLVKDAVSMSNRPPGGYILVGINDHGTLALPAGTIADRARFDGARLGDMIRKYIEGEVHVISQVHEVDSHKVVLIYFPHHRDGLPVPMSKLGQSPGQNGKLVVVFREGDVLVRDGVKNTPLRHAHWNDLLSRRDQRQRGDTRLRQFLGQASALVSNPDERRVALDKIMILGAHAMYFERGAIAEKAIDSLFDAYTDLGHGDAAARLDIITRVYALGSLTVRLRQRNFVRALALRPYPPSGGVYIYSSWVRHGQVDASRVALFPQGKAGLMICAARVLMSPTARYPTATGCARTALGVGCIHGRRRAHRLGCRHRACKSGRSHRRPRPGRGGRQ